MITYRPLPLRCQCGCERARIVDVGITPEHELVIRYWCSRCQKDAYIVRGLSDCWRDCEPDAAPAAEDAQPKSVTRPDDADFLRRMGISAA